MILFLYTSAVPDRKKGGFVQRRKWVRNMRKVALIEEQRRDREKEEILKSILDTMNAKRGQADLTKSEFAHKAGIHENTWAKWNKLGLKCASLWDILDAAQRVGVKIHIDVSL